MNWRQFKYPVFHMCLAGCCGNILVSNTRRGRFEPLYGSDKYFVTDFAEFSKTFSENSNETGLRKTRDY